MTSKIEQDLTELKEKEAIREMLTDYWWYLDTKQWDKWRDLFTSDIEFYVMGGLMNQGLDEFVKGVKDPLEGQVSAHQGHQYKIVITSPTSAVGRCVLNDIITKPTGEVMKGYGYYLYDFLKGNDGKWRIKVLKLGYFRLENSGQPAECISEIPYSGPLV